MKNTSLPNPSCEPLEHGTGKLPRSLRNCNRSSSTSALAGILILLGSLAEGFGYGLSLGTRWPYTRNILVLMVWGDPEAAHRLVATLVGLIALALVFLAPGSATINGLVLVIIAALFGIGTLHVLSGRMPAFVHGIHGLLAYGVFLSYACGTSTPRIIPRRHTTQIIRMFCCNSLRGLAGSHVLLRLDGSQRCQMDDVRNRGIPLKDMYRSGEAHQDGADHLHSAE